MSKGEQLIRDTIDREKLNLQIKLAERIGLAPIYFSVAAIYSTLILYTLDKKMYVAIAILFDLFIFIT